MSGAIAPELADELRRDPGWMFPWELAPGVRPPLLGTNLEPVHRARLELIERPVVETLEAAGPDASAIDLACCEGWFGHRLLEWGAGHVLGIDVRSQSIRRAELVRDHFGIPAERLSFACADVSELRAEELGEFDVVLVLGLVYHLENPVGAIRLARALARSLCVIESQLTRQHRPIVWGNGVPDTLLTAPASFAAHHELDADTNPLASTPSTLSLVPNRAALVEMCRVAGFEQLEFARAAADHDRQYVRGDRAVVLAR